MLGAQQRQVQHPALPSRREAGEEDLKDDSDLEGLASGGGGSGTAGLVGGSIRGNGGSGGGGGTGAGALAAGSGEEGLQDDSNLEGLPGLLPHEEQLQGTSLLLPGKGPSSTSSPIWRRAIT